MNSKNALAIWLSSDDKDYRTGVQIFISLNVDSKKNVFFNTTKPSKVHRDMLLRKLSNFARIHNIKSIKTVEKKFTTTEHQPSTKNVIIPKAKITLQSDTHNQDSNLHDGNNKPSGKRLIVDNNPIIRFEDLNEEMQKLYRENGPVKGQMNTLHAELKQLVNKTDEESKQRRSEIAHTLISLRQQYRNNWDAIETWYEQSKNKSKEELAVEDADKKRKRIDANLMYIKRNYFSEKKRQQTELKKRMAELDKWEVKYDGIIDQLKAERKQ